jgi:hypothetical protein
MVGGQRLARPFTPREDTRYPLYRRPGGPHDRSGPVRKTLLSPGFDPQTTHAVASRYTDYCHPPHTSSPLGTNVFLDTLYLNTLNLCSFLDIRDKFSIHTEQRTKLQVCTFLTFVCFCIMYRNISGCVPNYSRKYPKCFALNLPDLTFTQC